MFVPTQRTKHGHRDIEVLKTSKKGGFIWYAFSDGECHGTLKGDLNLWGYKPITLPCPSCNAEIQQAWRVECKCGWVAEAISESVLSSYKNISKSWDCTRAIDTGYYKYIFKCKDNPTTCDITTWKINSIHWLEIKAGE